MAIVVPCPGCPTRLSAPEAAVGKQLKCPKCGALATVPAASAAPADPPRPKPKPKAAPVEDDDDRPRARKRRDEDDDDDRPRRKKRYADDDDDDEYEHDRPRKKRRPASGGGGGKVVALVLGGVVLLVGLGVGVYMLVGKGGALAKKAPPPGWKAYENADMGIKGFFPSDPTVFGGKMGGPVFGGNIAGMEIPQIESTHGLTTGGFGGGKVNVTVDVTRFRGSLPRATRDAIGNIGAGAKFGGGEVRRVRWLGGDAAEVSAAGMVMRVVYTDKAMVMAQVQGAKPEEAEAFFDNFELTK